MAIIIRGSNSEEEQRIMESVLFTNQFLIGKEIAERANIEANKKKQINGREQRELEDSIIPYLDEEDSGSLSNY